MKYSEAEAKVKKLVHDPGCMKITLSYNTYIIVPYAYGQSYYDDKRKIQALTTELRALESASTKQEVEK